MAAMAGNIDPLEETSKAVAVVAQHTWESL